MSAFMVPPPTSTTTTLIPSLHSQLLATVLTNLFALDALPPVKGLLLNRAQRDAGRTPATPKSSANLTDYTSQYTALPPKSMVDSTSAINATSSSAPGGMYEHDNNKYNTYSSNSTAFINTTAPTTKSNIGNITNTTTSATTNANINTSNMVLGGRGLEATTTFPARTVATYVTAATAAAAAAGNKNRPTTIIVYPTVSPESIVIPIVSCIFGFPILALIVICCLRRRAKLARERDRRRNYDMQDHAVSLVRFSPIHRLNYRSSRAISLRPERSLSQGFTSLELDTVLEERCSDVEQTQTEILNPESPMETSSYKMSFSS